MPHLQMLLASIIVIACLKSVPLDCSCCAKSLYLLRFKAGNVGAVKRIRVPR
jgi:hypothetical protein